MPCTLTMKTNATSQRIALMAAITRMERGHLSVIRTGPDGQPYHRLPFRATWWHTCRRSRKAAADLVSQLLQEAADKIDAVYQAMPGEVRK